MNDFGELQQPPITERNIVRELKQSKWEMYAGMQEVITERSQRENLIPEGWLWAASGTRPDAIAYLSPKLETDRVMSVGKDYHNALWTVMAPTDHNGKYNSYGLRGAEICIVVPEEYVINSPHVFSSAGGINFDKGDFYLVGVQDVEIHDPNNHGGITFKTKRYSVVPAEYVDTYYQALGKEDRTVIYDSRIVDVPFKDQKADDNYRSPKIAYIESRPYSKSTIEELPIFINIPISQKELDLELPKYTSKEQMLLMHLFRLYQDGKLDTLFNDGKK